MNHGIQPQHVFLIAAVIATSIAFGYLSKCVEGISERILALMCRKKKTLLRTTPPRDHGCGTSKIEYYSDGTALETTVLAQSMGGMQVFQREFLWTTNSSGEFVEWHPEEHHTRIFRPPQIN